MVAFDFPASPTSGQTYAPAGGPTYVYLNSVWTVLPPDSTSVIGITGGKITIGNTAPSTPAVNDVWIDTT